MTCLEKIKNKIDSEYEITRTGAEQNEWAEKILSDFKVCEEAYAEYRLRKPPFKRFVEEVLPIARFVANSPTFKDSPITLRKGNQPFDAEVNIDGKTEYIEVVNSIDGQNNHIAMKILNAIGVAMGTVGHTDPSRVLNDIENKINHGYQGVFHLLVCLDFDAEIYDISNLTRRITDKFSKQKSFKTINLYERRDKKIYEL